MRLADVGDLPTSLATEQAAELTGFSRGAVWAAARDEGGLVVGERLICPVRCGRALRWPTAPILAALGLSTISAEAPPSESQSPAERGSAPADHRGTAQMLNDLDEVSSDGTAR